MVTIRNSAHTDITNYDDERSSLLDELISLLKNNEHMTSNHADMLIYVHEKPRCYHTCETSTGAKRASYTNLEAKMMVNNKITQGDKTIVR
jgi:hypothetical protein